MINMDYMDLQILRKENYSRGVVVRQEENGIAVDVEVLRRLSGKYSQRLDELRAEIYRLAGREFNIGSLKELQKILFEEQKLPVQTHRLDDLAQVAAIDMLKIDVQGAELMALDHGAHGAVENEEALREEFTQFGATVGLHRDQRRS